MIVVSVLALWIALAGVLTFCLGHAAARPFDIEADLQAGRVRSL
jgi:hypothetical protein